MRAWCKWVSCSMPTVAWGTVFLPHVSCALWSLYNHGLPDHSLEGEVGDGQYHPHLCQRWHGAVPAPTHP
jgi:hypothetical protein